MLNNKPFADYCKECMFDAPYPWCCKELCGDSEECDYCEAKSRYGQHNECLIVKDIAEKHREKAKERNKTNE